MRLRSRRGLGLIALGVLFLGFQIIFKIVSKPDYVVPPPGTEEHIRPRGVNTPLIGIFGGALVIAGVIVSIRDRRDRPEDEGRSIPPS